MQDLGTKVKVTHHELEIVWAHDKHQSLDLDWLRKHSNSNGKKRQQHQLLLWNTSFKRAFKYILLHPRRIYVVLS